MEKENMTCTQRTTIDCSGIQFKIPNFILTINHLKPDG